MTSNELRTILIARNIPQTYLAEKLGVDQRTVRRWCDARSNKKLSRLAIELLAKMGLHADHAEDGASHPQ